MGGQSRPPGTSTPRTGRGPRRTRRFASAAPAPAWRWSPGERFRQARRFSGHTGCSRFPPPAAAEHVSAFACAAGSCSGRGSTGSTRPAQVGVDDAGAIRAATADPGRQLERHPTRWWAGGGIIGPAACDSAPFGRPYGTSAQINLWLVTQTTNVHLAPHLCRSSRLVVRALERVVSLTRCDRLWGWASPCKGVRQLSRAAAGILNYLLHHGRRRGREEGRQGSLQECCPS
jgi:hypothetical protein